MRYIKNKFDDQVSKVTRDMIVDYPLYLERPGDDGLRDMVQVYPWENLGEMAGGTKAKQHRIKDKWFVTKTAWDEIANLRPLNSAELAEHIHRDPRVRIHYQGMFKYLQTTLMNNIKKITRGKQNVRDL